VNTSAYWPAEIAASHAITKAPTVPRRNRPPSRRRPLSIDDLEPALERPESYDRIAQRLVASGRASHAILGYTRTPPRALRPTTTEDQP
jgi:hypothetical protein